MEEEETISVKKRISFFPRRSKVDGKNLFLKKAVVVEIKVPNSPYYNYYWYLPQEYTLKILSQ